MKHAEHGYWKHFRHAFSMAYVLGVASTLGFIHAVIPCILEDCMSKRIKNLENK